MEYQYINPGVFNNKINYSYSKYGGIEFINAWKKSRTRCIDILLNVSDTKKSVSNTSKTGSELQNWLNNSQKLFSDLDKVHLLLKRFEVTKRIYETYTEEYRRINKDVKYDNLNSYISFGLVLVKLHNEFQKLQYVNTLLKLTDIICSRVFVISDANELAQYKRVVELIKEESRIINSLCNDKHIAI